MRFVVSVIYGIIYNLKVESEFHGCPKNGSAHASGD